MNADEGYQQQLEQEEYEMTKNTFAELAAINVNPHIEKKNGLSYLSWAWAVDQLLRADPSANWEYGEPRIFSETMMVFCTVTAFGIARTCQLPVMDHKNQAIKNPNAFQVNTAMQRCLVKAIAMHGLGLYIYAGEDLPYEDPTIPITAKQAEKLRDLMAKGDADEAVFVEWLTEKAHSTVEAIPAGLYDHAENALKQKIAKMNKEKAA